MFEVCERSWRSPSAKETWICWNIARALSLVLFWRRPDLWCELAIERLEGYVLGLTLSMWTRYAISGWDLPSIPQLLSCQQRLSALSCVSFWGSPQAPTDVQQEIWRFLLEMAFASAVGPGQTGAKAGWLIALTVASVLIGFVRNLAWFSWKIIFLWCRHATKLNASFQDEERYMLFSKLFWSNDGLDPSCGVLYGFVMFCQCGHLSNTLLPWDPQARPSAQITIGLVYRFGAPERSEVSCSSWEISFFEMQDLVTTSLFANEHIYHVAILDAKKKTNVHYKYAMFFAACAKNFVACGFNVVPCWFLGRCSALGCRSTAWSGSSSTTPAPAASVDRPCQPSKAFRVVFSWNIDELRQQTSTQASFWPFVLQLPAQLLHNVLMAFS